MIGETVSWDRKDIADFPPSEGWSLSYKLRGPSSIDIPTSVDGDTYQVRVTADVCKMYVAGDYVWEAWVSKDLERYWMGSGDVSLLPDFSVIVGEHDNRSEARKTLDNLRTTFYQLSTKGFSSISAEGEVWTKERLPDLITAIHEAERVVAVERMKENVRRGKSPGTRILTRFKSL